MTAFHETDYGRRFFDIELPKLIDALEEIGDGLTYATRQMNGEARNDQKGTEAPDRAVGSPESLRCAWEVTAGLVPDEEVLVHSRRWELTSAEWNGDQGYELFLQREALATAYVRYLQEQCIRGREVNWTRLDFVWY